MIRYFKRLSLPLLLCFVFVGTVATGCDIRKIYHGHKGDCRDDDCDGCDRGKRFPRDWWDDDHNDNGDNNNGNGDNNGGNGNDTTDRYRCLQSCYEAGHGKATCQARCANTGNPGTDGASSPDAGSSSDSGASTPDQGQTTDGGQSDAPSGNQPEIDQDAYDTCWRECKQNGEVDCVCESKCRSVARGVWVSKCWESCAKSQQDLAVCKQKCDA